MIGNIRGHVCRSAIYLCVATAAALAGNSALAQKPSDGSGVPSRAYFTAVGRYYDGDYREALALFRGEANLVPARPWLDSICAQTMAGECQYQMGQLPAALESYESALRLYMKHADWMSRLKAPDTIAKGEMKQTALGVSDRPTRPGRFPDTFSMSQAPGDPLAAVLSGGPGSPPAVYPIHAAELVRCTSLAIRRRRELLGPMCRFDPLTKDLVDVLVDNRGPTDHWLATWVNVELGCAYVAVGRREQAVAMLKQAVSLEDGLDHPLTSTALLELGRLAIDAGNFTEAVQYLRDASIASMTFTNLGNLEEAMRLATMAYLVSNPKETFAPLLPAVAWARQQNARQLQVSLLIDLADNRTSLGDADMAQEFLATARTTMGQKDLVVSQLGARLNHQMALASYQARNLTVGDQALAGALAFQKTGSPWLFQIALADQRIGAHTYADRTALYLYSTLLRDPVPMDWAWSPLDCLSVLSTPHVEAYEHWFNAVLNSEREREQALEIADRARRHRFYSSLPMGGRLTSIRWLLEGPSDLLNDLAKVERRDILDRYPRYRKLADEARNQRAKLDEALAADHDPQAIANDGLEYYTALTNAYTDQEFLLREIALRREPVEMLFPPVRKSAEIIKNLPPRQALLTFFSAGGQITVLFYTPEKNSAWRVNSPPLLQRQLVGLLRDLGNAEANRELMLADLSKGVWRPTAARLLNLLLEKSDVELGGDFDEIAIVPDDMLWYLPFELLNVAKPGQPEKLLIQHARVRYAPTASLAVPFGKPSKSDPKVSVVMGRLFPQYDSPSAPESLEQMRRVLPGITVAPKSIPTSSAVFRSGFDQLIVFDDILPSSSPYDWSPTRLDGANIGGRLRDWFSLPFGAPDKLILPGFHTSAENGMRRRNANGNEVFLSVCGLMSTGSRTILLSRWRTGGQTAYDLVREFAQELPFESPAAAWQRSVELTMSAPLDVDREPRLRKPAPETPPAAEHPFFWAGYMLIDPGTAPGVPETAAK